MSVPWFLHPVPRDTRLPGCGGRGGLNSCIPWDWGNWRDSSWQAPTTGHCTDSSLRCRTPRPSVKAAVLGTCFRSGTPSGPRSCSLGVRLQTLSWCSPSASSLPCHPAKKSYTCLAPHAGDTSRLPASGGQQDRCLRPPQDYIFVHLRAAA